MLICVLLVFWLYKNHIIDKWLCYSTAFFLLIKFRPILMQPLLPTSKQTIPNSYNTFQICRKFSQHPDTKSSFVLMFCLISTVCSTITDLILTHLKDRNNKHTACLIGNNLVEMCIPNHFGYNFVKMIHEIINQNNKISIFSTVHSFHTKIYTPML